MREGRSPWPEYVTAVLYNGLGRYQAALAAAQRACEHEDLGLFGWALDRAGRGGRPQRRARCGAGALRRLEERTRAVGTDWALGIEARSRALLSDGQAADALYREAIERLGRSRIVVHLARAHLSTANGCVARTAPGRPRAAAYRPRHVQPHRRRSVRRARPPRAARHRRDAYANGQSRRTRS